MLRQISNNDNLHDQNAKSWFGTSLETPPISNDFFPFLQRRITGKPTHEESASTLNTIQASASWQESGIQPHWLDLHPPASFNSSTSSIPASLSRSLGDMELATDMDIVATDNSYGFMRLEGHPISSSSLSQASPPTDIPAEHFDSLSTDPTYPLVERDVMQPASPSPPPLVIACPLEDSPHNLDDNLKANASPSPPPSSTQMQVSELVYDVDMEGTAPRQETDVDMLSLLDDASDITHIDHPLGSDSVAHASPSLRPGIIERRPLDPVNDLEDLSVHGDDAAKSLAYALNKANGMNASQHGFEASGNNAHLTKPAEDISNVQKDEAINLTPEEVCFDSFLGYYFY